MSRVHDMGGRFGDGPVAPKLGALEKDVFDTDWHATALALNLACGSLGQWNIDASRHARECLSPKDYSRFSYYEKWMAGMTDLLVATGVLSEAELQTGQVQGLSDIADRKLVAEAVAPGLAQGAPSDRAGAKLPLFEVGQQVVTREIAHNRFVEGGHTRLPGYASGKQGEIVLCHGHHVLPDTNAHFLGENPEPLYAVAFSAQDLWGNPEKAEDEVILDIWESYLSPA